MSIKHQVCVICDICGAEGPIILTSGSGARLAIAAARKAGWARVQNEYFGSGSKRAMDDVCPKHISKEN